jgi:hypothetical protein
LFIVPPGFAVARAAPLSGGWDDARAAKDCIEDGRASEKVAGGIGAFLAGGSREPRKAPRPPGRDRRTLRDSLTHVNRGAFDVRNA